MTNWKKQFYGIYLGQMFSILSSNVVQFSIIWWITKETNSAISLAIASIIGLLPQALLGIFAGVIIDRFDRKKIVIFSDILVACSSLLLTTLFLFGYRDIVFVYIVLFLRVIGETFHKPAMQSLIPSIVPKEEVTKANGYAQFINSACTMISPMLGALLMSITELEYAMLLDVFCAIIAVIILSLVKTKPHIPSKNKISFLSDINEGLLEFKNNKMLFRMSLPILLVTILFVPIGTLLPLIITNQFHGNEWHNAISQTLFSFGMLFGALFVAIIAKFKPFKIVSITVLILGICSVLSGFLSQNQFIIFCILVFIMGVCGVMYNIIFNSYVQQTVSPQNLGKVICLITSVMTFAAPIGMIIAGPISEIVGVSLWMQLMGIILIILGFICNLITNKTC